MLSQKELTSWEAEVDLADLDVLIVLRGQFVEMMEKYRRPRKKRTRASITTFRQWRELRDRASHRYYDLAGQTMWGEADYMGRIMAHSYAEELKKLQTQIAVGMQVPQKFLNISMSCKVPDDP